MKKIKKLFSYLKSPKILRVLILIMLLASLAGGFLYYQKARDRVYIENSLVSAPIIPVVPLVPGTLDKLYVYEGETIKKGDPIADVGDQTIRADTDAVVIKAANVEGSMISSQNPLVLLIKMSDLRLDGTIDENKGLNKIKIGQPVSFTVDAFAGKTYWGFVDEVSSTAKQTQIAFSISSERPTQQFEVFVKFDPNLYPELKNGMSAKMVVYVKNASI